MSEFHDLSELRLNDQGETWGNLGYWHGLAGQTISTYSQACRALADLVAQKAGLNEQSKVMDVGFGCGDQLLLWLNKYKVRSLRGINISTSQTNVALTKLTNGGYSRLRNQFHIGSASDHDLWQTLCQNSEHANNKINTVLALDCAYHFQNRRKFFQLASQHLDSNGAIVLTDFVLGTKKLTRIERIKLNNMLRLSRIPIPNIVTTAEYIDQLKLAGFREIEIVNLSDEVMPEFKQWLDSFKGSSIQKQNGHNSVSTSLQNSYGNLSLKNRLKYNGTATFLNWAYHNEVLQYAVVKARK